MSRGAMTALQGSLARLAIGLAAITVSLAAPAAAPGAETSRSQAITGQPSSAVQHDAPAPRIITLAPSATEMVFAAGAGAAIVGTVLSSDYPRVALDIPRVGDGIELNAEAILALKPTVLVGWQPSGVTRALMPLLNRLGVSLIYANPQSLGDIPAQILALGQALGTPTEAQRSAHALQARIDALPTPSGPPLSVFIEIGTDPIYTLGRDPLTDDLLTRCGGRNPYQDSKIAAPQISVESILELNPDAVIVSPYAHETLETRRAYWASLGLPAAVQDRIYAIRPDWLHRPGPRLLNAAEALCADLGQARQALQHQ